MSSLEWRDRAYEEAFEGTIAGLDARRRADPAFAIEDAEGILRHLYNQEGLDMGSRGMAQEAVLAATIAAYEHYICEWRAGTSPSDRSGS
jgi:hypothetical protein